MLKKLLLIVLGTIFLATGIIGIFLPLLPTTPFLLLAAACYTRSSPRLYSWLMDHPQLGSYIRNYREKKGLPRKTKIATLALLWLTLSISAAITQSPLMTAGLLIIGLAVSAHILHLKTLDH